ncbi:Glycosyl transferase family 2 [Mucilaginibacter gossypiicola]|uniref:Glycosyl transferase family 2 n=1 Tax=Mucilaginibacter gossypiicola TaxID=551995 RepID=A0A1H8BA64_9SPHI|nr:glycosyltransferase family A protein [Mucilaginibacter gossypiicola]SEM79606.1 Glycosyl transferase family 2 [Mucilaginibacter gossypiicola]
MQNQNYEGISVIMPTYNQGAFISRAIASLRLQTFENWELIIINDGSSDYTDDILKDYIQDNKIRIYSNSTNEGVGFCLNWGMELARFNLISYLPSDDIYYADHLSSLMDAIENSDAILAYSGVLHNYFDSSSDSRGIASTGKINGMPLQLVQVLHQKCKNRWTERSEIVLDDLDQMFWAKLKAFGSFVATNQITCEWVDHPEQRHKIINELYGGGLYLYKQYYNVKHPLRFKSSAGILIDEFLEYERFRGKITVEAENPLKILLVGELSYNAERIRAFEERGHQLYGLWLSNPAYYNTTGPLPFGNIIDISLDDWQQQVKEINPDIIYALLNHQAVPIANYILRSGLKIPFVWHFKEGPFNCRQNGTWKELIELFVNADGRIFINPESEEWFSQFLPADASKSFILDGDLPKREWFMGEKAELLSDLDGQVHTVIPGRPYGLTGDIISLLVKEKIHLHFYGDMYNSFWKGEINSNFLHSTGYIHVYPQCAPKDWITEFSKYDAGWLHLFASSNSGQYMKASWPDLNYPARMSTLAAAGLPMILKNNTGNIVATQSLIEKLDIGILFNSAEELASQLRDKVQMRKLRNNIASERLVFSFDYHVDKLIAFFRMTIARFEKNACDEMIA